MSCLSKQFPPAARAVLVVSLFLPTAYCLLPTDYAEAALSKSSSRRLETGETNEAGPSVSASTSGRRQQISVGGPFEGTKLSGSRFRVQSGFLAATLRTRKTLPPPHPLDLTVLIAKTDPLGTEIAQKIWQRDADPIFIWEAPKPGLDLAGYSYALDATLDDIIDTTATSWDVAKDPLKKLTDAKHTFSVKALNTAGNAGQAASFELWVDTVPPTINTYSPQSGTLLNSLSPTITAQLEELLSGIDPDDIVLSINGSSARVTFDEATGTMTASGAGLVKEGSNRIELRVEDRVGNAQTPLVWSVSADVTPPTGSVVINGDASMTTSVYVTLSLVASDATSGVDHVLISNDPLTGFVQEPFVSVRELWRLNAVRGSQRVYVKFVDKAGNASEAVFDDIDLGLFAPDTIILSGPAGLTPSRTAQFTFTCPEGECVFSYAFDHEDWSDWTSQTTASQSNLVFGNHYVKVKAAKEVNGIPGIQLDEEDPTPAERTWIVGVQPPVIFSPPGGPIKLWRIE